MLFQPPNVSWNVRCLGYLILNQWVLPLNYTFGLWRNLFNLTKESHMKCTADSMKGIAFFQIQKSPKESSNCRIYCDHFPDRIKTILVVNICSVSPFCLKCWKQSRGPNNLELHSGLSLRIAHLFSVCTLSFMSPTVFLQVIEVYFITEKAEKLDVTGTMPCLFKLHKGDYLWCKPLAAWTKMWSFTPVPPSPTLQECRVRTLPHNSHSLTCSCMRITKGCCFGLHQLPYINRIHLLWLEPEQPINIILTLTTVCFGVLTCTIKTNKIRTFQGLHQFQYLHVCRPLMYQTMFWTSVNLLRIDIH